MWLEADSTPVSTSIGGDVPNAPSGLGAAAGAGPKVTLNWTDNSANEIGFIIQRALNGGSWVQIATTLADVTTYVDTTVVGGASDAVPVNSYQYRVAAVGAVNQSGYATSNSVDVTKFPTAPASLGIQVAANLLVWTDASTNETSFQVQTSTTGGAPWTPAGVPIPRDPVQSLATGEVLSQTVPVCNPACNYLRVLAQNVTGSSASAILSLAIPLAPTQVTVTRMNATQATIAWTDASTNETSFQVQTSINNGTTWTDTNAAIARTPAQSIDTGESLTSALVVNADTNSLYRVLAKNGAGSTPSESVRLNNTVAPDAPGAPVVSCARVNASSSYATCTVTWTDLSNSNTSFQVQRADNVNFNFPMNNPGVLGANSVTTTFTYLLRTNNWYFRVRAINNSGMYSNWVIGQPSPFPAPIN